MMGAIGDVGLGGATTAGVVVVSFVSVLVGGWNLSTPCDVNLANSSAVRTNGLPGTEKNMNT